MAHWKMEPKLDVVIKLFTKKHGVDEGIRKIRLVEGATEEFRSMADIKGSGFNLAPLAIPILVQDPEGESLSGPVTVEELGELREALRKQDNLYAGIMQSQIKGFTLDNILNTISVHPGKYVADFKRKSIEKIIDGLVYFQTHPTRIQHEMEEAPDYAQKLKEAHEYFHSEFASVQFDHYTNVGSILGKIGRFLDQNASVFLLDVSPTNLVFDFARPTESLFRPYDEIVRKLEEERGTDKHELALSLMCSGMEDVGFNQEGVMELYASNIYFVDLDQINKRRTISEDISMLVDTPFVARDETNRKHFEDYFLRRYREVEGKDVSEEFESVKHWTAFFRNLRSAYHYLIDIMYSEVRKDRMAAGHLKQCVAALSDELGRRPTKLYTADLSVPELGVLRAWTLNFHYLLSEQVWPSGEFPSPQSAPETYTLQPSGTLRKAMQQFEANDFAEAKQTIMDAENQLKYVEYHIIAQEFRNAERWEDAIAMFSQGMQSATEDYQKSKFNGEIGYCYMQMARDLTPRDALPSEEGDQLFRTAADYFEEAVQGNVDPEVCCLSAINMLQCYTARKDLEMARTVVKNIVRNKKLSRAILSCGLQGPFQEAINEYQALALTLFGMSDEDDFSAYVRRYSDLANDE